MEGKQRKTTKVPVGEIRKALEFNSKVARGWGTRMREESWYRDASIESIGRTFLDCLPESYLHDPNTMGEAFKKYIENTLSKSKEKRNGLTAVEFGGPGSALFAGFSKGFFGKTIGVCLKDLRQDTQKEREQKNGHLIIEGNILDVINYKVYGKVATQLANGKTDLIISRMMGPLDQIEKNPAILDRVIRKWYGMLNTNGIMFIQIEFSDAGDEPFTYNHSVRRWADAIHSKCPEIEIQFDRPDMPYFVKRIRLHKNPGAPEELPSAAQMFKVGT